jgi:CheY-like chemotaxis protein
MEAVGRLAGGIAHDFNNVLTVIRGYGALLLAKAEDDDPDRDDLLAIVQAADQAADLTRQLLTFSRGQPPSTTSVDLNTLVAETGAMLGRLLGENVELDLWLPAYPVVVRADSSGLQQALVNLAVNARDAMPDGGSLIVETRIEPTGGPGPDADAPVGVLRVSDTGHGMDEETRARAFEPFFTTKPTGKGTGLGLATVYGIVTQAGGAVILDTSPGKGATFTIRLPTPVAATAPPAPTLPSRGRGSERVLLAEDEDAVRALISTVLTERGYTVLEARDGLEALEIAGRFGGSLDILLTDVVMPQMTGVELAHRLRESDPSLPVLFVSGHMGDERPAAWSDPDVPLLRKPFTPHELVGAVRAALDVDSTPAAGG